jgi:uncharacterized protein (TIGR00159 family)
MPAIVTAQFAPETLLAATAFFSRLLDVTLIRSVYLRDLLDVALVALLAYSVILLLKKARSLFLLNGMVVLLVIYTLARLFNFYLTTVLFNFFLGFFVIIFVIIFQREIRQFFEVLSRWRKLPRAALLRIPDFVTNEIIHSARVMMERRMGGLIVLPGDLPLERFLQGGTLLNGRVSVPLLLSIFDPSTPGHDGAVVLEGDRVKIFAAHLPLGEHLEEVRHLGTRHRAALGLAERTDALVIVISEERGRVSVAEQGALRSLRDVEELQVVVHDFLKKHRPIEKQGVRTILLHNAKEKLMAVAFASLLWYVFVLQLGGGITTRQIAVPIEFHSLPLSYTIESVVPVEVAITLSGRNQDFNILNDTALKISLEATSTSEGWQHVTLSKTHIQNLPPVFSVTKLSPDRIQYRIAHIAPEEK